MTQGCPKRGIVPPLITPLKRDGTLDRHALYGIVERMIDAGVDGIFALGTTGEAPSLGAATRFEVVREVCATAGGRVPVLVGVTDSSLEEALRLADYARQSGATAIVAAPPFYFQISQAELEEFFQRLAAEARLPLYLYNFPSLTKVRFEIETLVRLARLPNVVGFKDSSGDLDYFRQAREALAEFQDFAIFMGPEEMLAESLHLGGTGGVTGGANLLPELFVSLYRAVTEGRVDEERRLQARVMAISNKLYGLGGYGTSFLKGMKAAMSLNGLCENVLAPPNLPLNAADCELVRGRMGELGLLVAEGEPAPMR